MNKTQYTLAISFSVFLVTLLTSCNDRKVGYIDNNKVVSEFKLSKTFYNQREQLGSEHKFLLDSLKLEIELLDRKYSNDKNDTVLDAALRLKQRYNSFSDRFSKEESELEIAHNRQVSSYINQKAEEFSIQNDLDILFGANGNGNLMYAEKSLNYTDQFIEFINQEYE